MKGFAMIFMAFLYTALIILTMVFSFGYLITDDYTKTLSEDQNTLKFGLIALIVNHLVRFVMEFIVEKGYKTMEPIGIMFKTFIYAMPVAFIVVFGVENAIKLFGKEHSQLVAISIIIIAKALVDLLFIKIGPITKNINFEVKKDSENQ
jgi:hypothetical protein